jgi:S1-C subfamily serine protease
VAPERRPLIPPGDAGQPCPMHRAGRRATTLIALAVAGLAACGDSGDSADERPSPERRAPAQAPAAGEDTLAVVPEVHRRLAPSVVAVLAEGAGEGSGVVIRKRRIVTNNHVIEGAGRVRIALASGEHIPARVVAAAPRDDLAVLAVERDLPPATFAEESPAVGSLAIAIGNPLGFEGSVTAGIVSGLDRAVPSGGTTPALVNLLQTDAAISPGNSGGALVGADGRVIGVNVAYIPPQGGAVSIGFAIPSPTVRHVVDELLRDGEVEYAYVGAQLAPLTPDIAQQLGIDEDEGAVVVAVAAESPGADAGLRPGDLIVRFGDEPVRSVEDLYAALRERSPGDRVEVEVVRGGRRQTVDVRLGERPETGGR